MMLGASLGRSLPDNSVVCFFGELGAGKTTFIKGLAAGAAGISPDTINSPTFVYLNIYTGNRTVYHFDLYRLRDADEFMGMGFDEYFHAGGICCIEWSERIASLLPDNVVTVRMAHVSPNEREIEIVMENDGSICI